MFDRSKAIATVAMVMVGGLLSLACGSPQGAAPAGGGDGAATASNEPKTGGIVRIIWNTDPVYLDPIRKNISDMELITGGTYGMLMRYKLGKDFGYTSTVLQPYLAEKWEVSADAKSYTFNLRKGVKMENKAPLNGREFTAKDVKWNLERYRDDKQSTAVYMVEGIASIDTPDDYTVKVNFKEPFAPFLTYAGNNELMMVPRELVDAGIADKQAIGYGPFRLDTAQKGSVYKLRKNPDFFLKDAKGRALPYIDGYEAFLVPDEQAQIAAFMSGQADVCGRCLQPAAGPLVQTLQQGAPDATIIKNLDPGGDKIYISNKWAPAQDLRVRQAIRIALDPKAMIQTLVQGNGEVNIAGVGPAWGDWTLPAAEREKFYPHDAAKSKALLKEAGFDTLPVDILYSSGSGQSFLLFAQMVESQLKAAGFAPKITTVDDAVAFDRKRKADFELHVFGGSYRPDPDGNLYATFKCGSSLNYSQACDRELDPILDNQRKSVDDKERHKLVADALRLINDRSLGFIQPYVGSSTYYWRPYLKGYYPHMYWGMGLKYMEAWLDK